MSVYALHCCKDSLGGYVYVADSAGLSQWIGERIVQIGLKARRLAEC